MAQKQAYYCDLCGQNINDDAPHDFVFYMVAGNVNGRAVDIEDMDLPEHLKLLLAQKTPRLELCVSCVAGGEVDLGPVAKGRMLGHLIAREREANMKRGGRGKGGQALADQREKELREKFAGVEPIDPAGEW